MFESLPVTYGLCVETTGFPILLKLSFDIESIT